MVSLLSSSFHEFSGILLHCHFLDLSLYYFIRICRSGGLHGGCIDSSFLVFFIETLLPEMYPFIVPLVSSGPEKCMVVIYYSFPPALIENHLGFARLPPVPGKQLQPSSSAGSCFYSPVFYFHSLALILSLGCGRDSSSFTHGSMKEL